MQRSPYRGWLTLLVFAMTATLLTVSLTSRKSPLERFRDRIVIGSTRAEVEEALGGPPGDYRTEDDLTLALGLAYDDYEFWWFDSAILFVKFDEQQRVLDIHGSIYNFPYRPWWQRITGK